MSSPQILTKCCSSCNLVKSTTEFYKRGGSRTDVQHHCKACMSKFKKSPEGKAASKQHYEKYKDKILKRHKENRKGKREYYLEYHRRYYQLHKDKVRKRYEAYYKTHKADYARRTREREGALKKATPSWLTSFQRKEMNDFYKNCPPGYHVDHIIPLNNPIICGLHVPWNLQYLPAKENLAKGNKLVA